MLASGPIRLAHPELSSLLKTRKIEEEVKRYKEKERGELFELSLKKSTDFPLIVLLPREELFIKEQ